MSVNVEWLAQGLADVDEALGWQIALDIVVEGGTGGRVMAIECNPRATSGIHFFSGTTRLAEIITSCVHQNENRTLAEQEEAITTPSPGTADNSPPRCSCGNPPLPSPRPLHLFWLHK